MSASNLNANPQVSRDALTHALDGCSAHLRPIILAVRDHGCGFASIIQEAGPFELPLDLRPTVVLLGDDLMTSKGPTAFDATSLLQLARQCAAAYVIASAAEAQTYAKAVTWAAILRQHVVIVETLPAHEEAWVECLLQAKPDLQITVSKVDPLARPEPQTWGRA